MHGYIDNEYTQPRLGRSRIGVAPVAASTPARTHAAGRIRRFSQALLATLVSTLVIVADRMVDAWTSGGLLVALVVLWLSVFLGLVLFSRVSARLAVWTNAAWRDAVRRTEPALAPDARQG